MPTLVYLRSWTRGRPADATTPLSEAYASSLVPDQVELLELAVDDRSRLDTQPLVQNGGVGATEVVVELEVAPDLVLFMERRVLSVKSSLDSAAYDERHPSRAVVRSRTRCP